MIQVKRVQYGDRDDAERVFMIRRKVFVEEQGVDPDLEYDVNDPSAHHYLLTVGDTAVGAARWRETKDGIKLERFAVLREFRNRGLGEILLSEVIKDVRDLGKKVYLHSQLRAVPFYERNGFVKSGAVFYEAGMGHYYMELMTPGM